jgi:hypothetical protein
MASLWKLEEGSGETFFYDEIGSNHGSLDGESMTQIDGRVGFGQQFSAGDIVIDPNQDMNWAINEDFAIEFWMRSDGSGEEPEVIVGRRSSIQGNRSQLWVGIEGNLPKLYVRFANSASFSLYGVPIDDGQWHHIVAVHESLSEEVSQFRFYVDGVQRGIRNQTLGERTLELSTEEITLGSLDGDYFYQGMLDEVAIYRGFPDVERIQLHYNNGLAGRGYCDAEQPIGEVTITSTPVTAIALGAAYSYQVTATGEPTSFTLGQAPQGMSITPEGLITWTPQELGSFDVQVTAANNQSSDTQTFVVEVRENQPPTAVAGEDQTVTSGTTVTLDGGESSDPDGQIAAYQWSQLAGPEVVLSDPNAQAPTFVAPQVNGESITLEFQLAVTDDLGITATDTTAVMVDANQIVGFPEGVATFMNYNDSRPMGIATDENSSLVYLRAVDPAEIAETRNRPTNLDWSGLVEFVVKVQNPGDTATVTIYLQEPAPEGYDWVKYSEEQGWQNYTEHAEFNADRTEITLTLQDGGIGDADPTANGLIRDPSGLGIATTTTGGGSSSSGGCSIAPHAEPGMEWLLLLMAPVLVALIRRLRHR